MKSEEFSNLSLPSKIAKLVTFQSDRYGLAYFISYRIAGVLTVWGIFAATKYGIDLHWLEEQIAKLNWMNLTFDTSNASRWADWAGAVVCGGMFFPITVFLAPHIAKRSCRLRQGVISKFKSKTTIPKDTKQS